MARQFMRRSADVSDRTSVVMSSHMCVYKSDTDAVLRNALSMDWFVASAHRYRLSGMPVRSLCEHNANVASGLSRSQVRVSIFMPPPTYIDERGGKYVKREFI